MKENLLLDSFTEVRLLISVTLGGNSPVRRLWPRSRYAKILASMRAGGQLPLNLLLLAV